MSVNSKMTAIADAVRDLRGMSGTMGLDAMATNINGAKTAVDAALTALSEKGVTVPSGTKVDGLAALIAEIEAGGGSGGDGMKVAFGKIIPSENLYICEITHNLGVIPNFALIVGGYSYKKAANESLSTIAHLIEQYGDIGVQFEAVRSTTTASSGVRAGVASISGYSLDWTPNNDTVESYNGIGGLFYGADASKIYYGHPTLQTFFMKSNVPYFYLIGYKDDLIEPY